jgi:MFS family permease
VSWLTSSIMIGVILFQVPVAWFADRLGRTQVLLGCYGMVIAGLCFLPFCGDSAWLALWLFLVGACSGAFYPLGLAVLGERIAPSGLARANAWFLGVNCLGSWMGPDIMGFVMEQWGKRALFVTGLTAVVAVLVCWLGVRWYHLRHDLHAHAIADPVSGSEQRLAA